MDDKETFENIKKQIKEFNQLRNWDKYHRPKDLILALIEELGELSRIFKWVNTKNEFKYLRKNEVKEEIADIFIYLFILCYKADIDISDVIIEKLRKNDKKYPIGKKFRKGGYKNGE
ncbi:MAG TPA: nucleotide pyrophosphohydrolase [Candidatus Atribacteria bacterium]|nr:nucleotide pyrophosphohydrolase [Candidatus Atribacteria bacterium]